MRLLLTLTAASLKMYFREREAIIWTFIFPILAIAIFSFVRLNGTSTVALGLVVPFGETSEGIVRDIRGVETFNVQEGRREVLLRGLERGDLDLVLFADGARDDSLTVVRSTAKPRQAELGLLLLRQILDERALADAPQVVRTGVRTEEIAGRSLRYVDFLLPGILGMSIMQLGIFGVAFGFVSLKRRGILRRLSVTPIRPRDFIVAQVITRVLVLLLQIVLMVAVAVLILHLHVAGNILTLLMIGVLGSVVFLAIGFTLAGVASSENQVAPMANLISLPLLLLSGVFFDRANLPGFLRAVTDFIPLSNLVDALRAVTIEGAVLSDIWPQLLGLVIWGLITVAIAVKAFRWE